MWGDLGLSSPLTHLLGTVPAAPGSGLPCPAPSGLKRWILEQVKDRRDKGWPCVRVCVCVRTAGNQL